MFGPNSDLAYPVGRKYLNELAEADLTVFTLCGAINILQEFPFLILNQVCHKESVERYNILSTKEWQPEGLELNY